MRLNRKSCWLFRCISQCTTLVWSPSSPILLTRLFPPTLTENILKQIKFQLIWFHFKETWVLNVVLRRDLSGLSEFMTHSQTRA